MKLARCNGCGFRKPMPKELNHNKHAVKCPQCGMNTGPHKNPTRAVRHWNQNHRGGSNSENH